MANTELTVSQSFSFESYIWTIERFKTFKTGNEWVGKNTYLKRIIEAQHNLIGTMAISSFSPDEHLHMFSNAVNKAWEVIC